LHITIIPLPAYCMPEYYFQGIYDLDELVEILIEVFDVAELLFPVEIHIHLDTDLDQF
jgi:hypothetical protein